MERSKVFKFSDWNTVDEVFRFIRKYPNDNITFDYEGMSYGDGANAHILVKLATNLVDLHLCKKNIYFVDIAESSKFWKNDANIRAFAKFLYLIVTNKTKLPYHLPLPLLENIVGKKMSNDELEYFFSWTDLPNSNGEKLLPKILSYSKEDLQSVECESPYDVVKDILENNFMSDHDTYKKIARFFTILFPTKFDSIKELDSLISTTNHISVNDILKTIKFENDPDSIYILIFTDFLDTLSNDERKLFFESYNVYLSTDVEFTIRLEDVIPIYDSKTFKVIRGYTKDVEIITCYKLIKIRKGLFHSSLVVPPRGFTDVESAETCGMTEETNILQDPNSEIFSKLKQALIHTNNEELVDEEYVPPEVRNNPAMRMIPIPLTPAQYDSLHGLFTNNNAMPAGELNQALDNEIMNVLNEIGALIDTRFNGVPRVTMPNQDDDEMPPLETALPQSNANEIFNEVFPREENMSVEDYEAIKNLMYEDFLMG